MSFKIERSSTIAGSAFAVDFPKATHEIEQFAVPDAYTPDDHVVIHGYLSTQRVASSKLVFVELLNPQGTHSIQVKLQASSPNFPTLRELVKTIRPYSPLAVTGKVEQRAVQPPSGSSRSDAPARISDVEIRVGQIQALNDFPKDIIVAEGTVLPPEQRHLQLRTGAAARNALYYRSKVYETVRNFLCKDHGFAEIETPLLFKSTPEGAHEFLVPTRNAGHAYALPQSPQQYKQILMASGIPRYMQIAKCFRDEDLRADRQPEFTQVDIEMAFAGQVEVMAVIEGLIRKLWKEMAVVKEALKPFDVMTYQQAMSRYGSDKPDVRFGSEIKRVDHMVPVDFARKISDLALPAIDVFKMSISDDHKQASKFVNDFMDSPEAQPFIRNPHGQPGIFVFSARKPMSGLQPLGFEASEVLEEDLELEEGDTLVFQARPDEAFSGGATMTGNLRLALHKAAVAQGLVDKPEGWEFLWVTEFPLFTPEDEPCPGEEERTVRKLSSTHHPFTAPLTVDDARLLLTAPHEAKAAHYDLVLNGVELGGGSRRIHHSAMQRLVLEDILKLSPERMADFEHLLEVLRAGCPPHAGMALGLDRLVMLMLGRESVREVMAFPKGGGGLDGLVKAPSRVGEREWGRYGLKVMERDK